MYSRAGAPAGELPDQAHAQLTPETCTTLYFARQGIIHNADTVGHAPGFHGDLYAQSRTGPRVVNELLLLADFPPVISLR